MLPDGSAAHWDEGGWTDPEVLRVSPKEPNQVRRADVVLVHGFNGHYLETWQFSASAFWPSWIHENVQGVRVLLVSYYAGWSLSEGPLFDNVARGVLTALHNAEVGTAPIVFVCHSLGGLIIKRVLEIDADEKIGGVWSSTRGVVFFSTPHGGSDLANFASFLGQNRMLAYLRDKMGEGELEEFHRRFSAKIKPRLDSGDMRVFNFYEEKKLHKFRVVTPEQARRGFEYLASWPVPANHFWMVKFPRRQNMIYVQLYRKINDWLATDAKLISVEDSGIDSCDASESRKTLRFPGTLLRDFALVLLGAGLITLLLYLWGTLR